MNRLPSLLALALVALSVGAETKFKILPAAGPYYLDDAIEIIFDRGSSSHSFLQTPGSESMTNFTASLETYSAGGREFGRLILQPIAAGPASFGPSAIATNTGGETVALLPRLDFVIQPPIDTGTSPIDQVFADQILHGRLPAVIRAETIGDAMPGRAFIIRWYLYSERAFGDARVPPFEIPEAKPKVDPYYSSLSDTGFTSVGNALVHKRLIREYFAMPDRVTSLEMPPVFCTLRLLPDMVKTTGLTTTRRIMVLPPITIAPRPANIPPNLPVGSFEIECPRHVERVSEHRVATSVRIKGDGIINGSRLRFEGDSPTPVFADEPNSHQPSFRDAKIQIGGVFHLWTGPIEKGRSDVPFPVIRFDYYDLPARANRTLTCNEATLTIPTQSSWGSASEPVRVPKRPARREAPKRSNALFFVAEVVASLFVAGSAVALVTAIRRP